MRIGRTVYLERAFAGVEVTMSIATEILSLRRDQSSSVAALIGAIEWENAAEDDIHTLARGYDVMRIADIVLLNVAAHAAAR